MYISPDRDIVQLQSHRNEPAETDYTKYVNTFIGAADNGHTLPRCLPTFRHDSNQPCHRRGGLEILLEYVNSDSIIWGFTQTHLNGTGCMDLGDVVMPVTGTRTRAWDAYRSRFSKKQEAATPGYYTVELTEPNVKAELTATPTQPCIATPITMPTLLPSSSTCNTDRHGTKPISLSGEGMRRWTGKTLKPWPGMCATVFGSIRIISSWWSSTDPSPTPSTCLWVRPKKANVSLLSLTCSPAKNCWWKSLSTTRHRSARKNMEAEVPAWDFEGVKKRYMTIGTATWAASTWPEQKTKPTYTCFYHALIQPNQISDVDGLYRNAADSVVKAGTGTFYSTFSLWDTYRAAHPFYTLMVPER